jgi:hypothetical protein
MAEVGGFFCSNCSQKTVIDVTGMKLDDYKFIRCANCGKVLRITVGVNASVMSEQSIATQVHSKVRSAVSGMRAQLVAMEKDSEPYSDNAVIALQDMRHELDSLEKFASVFGELCAVTDVKVKEKK